MSILELFGIIFLGIILINIAIGIWAIKTAERKESKINSILSKQEN
jgi:hypothetical protein